MTYTEQAIKIATENSYELPWVTKKQIAKLHRDDYSTIFLDPAFWQALWTGKKLDSKMKWYVCPKDKDAGEFLSYKHCPQCGTELVEEVRMTQNWKAGWHRFIDNLAQGGSIDDFFNDLLK